MKRSPLSLMLVVIAAPALIAGGLLGGCQMDRDDGESGAAQASQPSIGVTASNQQIVSGEITTFTVDSANILGRNAEVEWTTTGGEIMTQEGGSVARARFDQPGAYTVTARLLVDGIEVDRDSVTINVRPLR